MTTPADSMLAEMMRYNNWANERVLDACAKLTDEQLETSAPGAYGPIRETLGHIIRAESWYHELLTGTRPQPPFKWEDKPGLAEMRAYATQVAEALTEAVERVKPTTVVAEEDKGQTWHYQAAAVFIQIINHGVEHRTNITTILSQMGLEAPGVDGWGYLSANVDRLGAE